MFKIIYSKKSKIILVLKNIMMRNLAFDVK